MKKYIFALLLLPLVIQAQQTPFGYNAKWIFDYYEAGFSGVDSLYHQKDSLFMGETWQFMKRGWSGNGSIFVQTRNDTVYYLKDTSKAILFIRNVSVGSSWNFMGEDSIRSYFSGCIKDMRSSVSLRGADTISGSILHYSILESEKDTISGQYRCASPYCLEGKVYDLIGPFNLASLYPFPNTCNGIVIDFFFYNFRCFQDDSISINFTQHSCKTGIGLVENEKAAFKIYPNPATDFITIQTEQAVAKVEIYNLLGQLQVSTTRHDVVELPAALGVYLVHLWFKNGELATSKIIKY